MFVHIPSNIESSRFECSLIKLENLFEEKNYNAKEVHIALERLATDFHELSIRKVHSLSGRVRTVFDNLEFLINKTGNVFDVSFGNAGFAKILKDDSETFTSKLYLEIRRSLQDKQFERIFPFISLFSKVKDRINCAKDIGLACREHLSSREMQEFLKECIKQALEEHSFSLLIEMSRSLYPEIEKTGSEISIILDLIAKLDVEIERNSLLLQISQFALENRLYEEVEKAIGMMPKDDSSAFLEAACNQTLESKAYKCAVYIARYLPIEEMREAYLEIIFNQALEAKAYRDAAKAAYLMPIEKGQKGLKIIFNQALESKSYGDAAEAARYMPTEEDRQACLEKVFNEALERMLCRSAIEAARYMTVAKKKESYLEKIYLVSQGRSNYSVSQGSSYFFLNLRMDDFDFSSLMDLEELPRGVIRNTIAARRGLSNVDISSPIQEQEFTGQRPVEDDSLYALIHMAPGELKESRLESIFCESLEIQDYIGATLAAREMTEKVRSSYLEKVFDMALSCLHADEAFFAASQMPNGEKREAYLERVFNDFFAVGVLNKATLVAREMAVGANREACLEQVFNKTLESRVIDKAFFAARGMTTGIHRENCLKEIFSQLLEVRMLDEAIVVVRELSVKANREESLERLCSVCILLARFNKLSLLEGRFSCSTIINAVSKSFRTFTDGMSIFQKKLYANRVCGGIQTQYIVSALKKELFPIQLIPTKKGVSIPVFVQTIPNLNDHSILGELKLLNLSQEEQIELDGFRDRLGVRDVPLLKWFALYDEPESDRIGSAAYNEFSEFQQMKLRELPFEQFARFWELNEKQMVKDGCFDLFQRIQNKAPFWRIGDLVDLEERKNVLYERMSLLVTHLLQHAKEKEQDRSIIFSQLARLAGRCEGVLTEIERMYQQFCLQKEVQSTLDEALELEAFYIRNSLFNLFVNENNILKENHVNTVFNNLVASDIGIPLLLEGAFEQTLYYRRTAEQFSLIFLDLFFSAYGEKFVEDLEKFIKDSDETSSYKIQVRNGEFELFSELLLKDMVQLGVFGDVSAEINGCKEELIQALKDPNNWENESSLKEKFIYMAEDAEEALELLSGSVSTFQEKLIIYPLLREKLTKKLVADYLVLKGLFDF